MPPPPPTEDALAHSAVTRWLLRAAGLALVGLADVGVVVAGLPTTPRRHAWLLASPAFGPLIREWQETRTVPLRAKVLAIGMITLVGGSSLAIFVHHPGERSWWRACSRSRSGSRGSRCGRRYPAVDQRMRATNSNVALLAGATAPSGCCSVHRT